MDEIEFKQKLISALPVGTVLKNPGGGTSIIESYSYDKIQYLRGDSHFYVRFQNLYDAYQRFTGSYVSTTDLKGFNPSVFDSKARPAGHDCNCTFLFLVLQRMEFVSKINGRGVSGQPYYVFIHN